MESNNSEWKAVSGDELHTVSTEDNRILVIYSTLAYCLKMFDKKQNMKTGEERQTLMHRWHTPSLKTSSRFMVSIFLVFRYCKQWIRSNIWGSLSLVGHFILASTQQSSLFSQAERTSLFLIYFVYHHVPKLYIFLHNVTTNSWLNGHNGFI